MKPWAKAFRLYAALAVLCAASAPGPARADAVLEWNAIMQATVQQSEPYIRIRSAAIAQLAVFEAVNAIRRDYDPYLGNLAASAHASPEAAAVSAAHRVLTVLHPDGASTLDAKRATSLAAIADGAAKNKGIDIGIAAANAILALRANDGSDVEVPYTPGTKPGEYRPTPPDFSPAFRPGLGRIATFAVRNGAQFRADPPPPIGGDEYAQHYREVKRFGAVESPGRSQYQTNIARFYEVTDGVELWFPAARQVSEAQHRTLPENARIFALLGMAIFDAAVVVFDTKYTYNLWRPVTAIRAGDEDGNPNTQPDPQWMPLISTPPFPSYASGHAGFGAASRRVLEEMFGAGGHSITLDNPLLPDVALHYSSWKQITDDVDDARVFGGVHFRFDQTVAARQGRVVGAYVLQHQLRPRCKEERGFTTRGASLNPQ